MFILINFLATIAARMKLKTTLSLLLLIISAPTHAQWNVMTHTDTDTGVQISVATIENQDNYKLEIYRDSNNVIRLRFNIRDSYDLLAIKQCPTYQVDKRKLSNRSINDAPCISQARWAEYVMGYISDDEVMSLPLHNLMNGNVIYYRFILKNGNYGETSFSLSGSKNILLSALGRNLTIKTK